MINTDLYFVSLIASTFFLAGIVKGITGMGLPTVAMGMLGALLSPLTAAAMLVVPSLVTNIWQLVMGPNVAAIALRLWPMMLGIIVGTLLGAAMLAGAQSQWAAFGLGVILLVYAGYSLAAKPVTVATRFEHWLAPLIGLATGLITGCTGVLVIPAVPYLQALKLEKEALIQALGLSFTVSTLALAGGLAWHGAFHLHNLGASTLAVLPALAGMWVGQKIRARISAQKFRLCFLAFLLVLGSELVLRPFM